MSDPPNDRRDFAGQIGVKAARKLKARRNPKPGVWFGLGMMGLIGWSVTVPTLLGAALGIWLDKHHPGNHPWTLALLVAGLTLGCRLAAMQRADKNIDELLVTLRGSFNRLRQSSSDEELFDVVSGSMR